MRIFAAKAITAREVLDRIRERVYYSQSRIRENSEEFRYQVIIEAENGDLSGQEIRKLADFLMIPFDEPPKEYRSWRAGLNYGPTCVKYTHPHNPSEYILLVHPRNIKGDIIGSREILHAKGGQFVSIESFQKVVPYFELDLAELKNDLQMHIKNKHPNIRSYDDQKLASAVRAAFGNTVAKTINMKEKIDPFVIQLIHAFFGVAIPQVDGICRKCSKVFMPRTGCGMSVLQKISRDLWYEFRMSPSKLGGYEQQTELYITNRLNVYGTVCYVRWHELPGEYSLTRFPNEQGTHIPYVNNNQQSVFEFLKSQASLDFLKKYMPKIPNIVIPICRCK